jgi:hypothetical protein
MNVGRDQMTGRPSCGYISLKETKPQQYLAVATYVYGSQNYDIIMVREKRMGNQDTSNIEHWTQYEDKLNKSLMQKNYED